MLVEFSMWFALFLFPLGAMLVLSVWFGLIIAFLHVGIESRLKGGRAHFAGLSAFASGLLTPVSYAEHGPVAFPLLITFLICFAGIYADWFRPRKPRPYRLNILDAALWLLPIVTVILSMPSYDGMLSYVIS